MRKREFKHFCHIESPEIAHLAGFPAAGCAKGGDFWNGESCSPNVFQCSKTLKPGGRRAIRHVVYDANFWKSFVYARLAVAMGDPGGLSLFGDRADVHRQFIEHLLSEYRVKTEGRGRVVDEWKLRPERGDNHWWDGLVGCAVAGSMLGATLPGTPPVMRKRTIRRTMAEWAALAKQQRERELRERLAKGNG